jgi:hypothetical protein
MSGVRLTAAGQNSREGHATCSVYKVDHHNVPVPCSSLHLLSTAPIPLTAEIHAPAVPKQTARKAQFKRKNTRVTHCPEQ